MKLWFRSLEWKGRTFRFREPIEVELLPGPDGFVCMYGFDCACQSSICSATETSNVEAVEAAVAEELDTLWRELVLGELPNPDANDLCWRQHLLDLVMEVYP